jgi:predicted extracellular nuclease
MYHAANRFASRLVPLLALGLLLAWPLPALAVSTTVAISQVYGGGGNSGATYTNDFIELHNLSLVSVDVTGWSVQYASSTGSTWQVTPISGVIPAGGYYLIQEAQGSGGTTPLPTPDATGTIAMSATSGKVALVAGAVALSGTCPTGSPIVDMVGYGSANCFEGAAAAQALSNTTAAVRLDFGCVDTDSNISDFYAAPPTPQNSGFTAYLCTPPVPDRASTWGRVKTLYRD